MDYKLGLVIIPVSDVDRARAFYNDKAAFRVDVDFKAGDFRVVQLSPRGSSCAIALMTNPAAAGSAQGTLERSRPPGGKGQRDEPAS